MGIYWYAVDYSAKEKLEPPGDYANKFAGICHPTNIFPQLLVFANCMGSRFEMINDMNDYSECEFKDVTEEILTKYKEKFSEYFIEEAKKLFEEDKSPWEEDAISKEIKEIKQRLDKIGITYE